MTVAERSFVEKLVRAQVRREKRFAATMVVYTYRHHVSGDVMDNLISLPKAFESVHRMKLEHDYFDVLRSIKDVNKRENLALYDIVRIGSFNKNSLDFTKCKPVVVVRLADVLKQVKDFETKKEIENV